MDLDDVEIDMLRTSVDLKRGCIEESPVQRRIETCLVERVGNLVHC